MPHKHNHRPNLIWAILQLRGSLSRRLKLVSSWQQLPSTVAVGCVLEKRFLPLHRRGVHSWTVSRVHCVHAEAGKQQSRLIPLARTPEKGWVFYNEHNLTLLIENSRDFSHNSPDATEKHGIFLQGLASPTPYSQAQKCMDPCLAVRSIA